MKVRDIDWIVLTMAAALTGIGLAMIYSALQPLGEYASSSSLVFFKRQVLWVAPALVAGVIGLVVPFRFFESLAYTLYVLGLILLIVVLIIPSKQETARWLVFGPLRVQPSEMMKIAFIFLLARVLTGYRSDPNKLKTLMMVLFLSGVPFLLILRQPDLGTALTFMCVLLPVLYWRGFRGIHILFLLSPLVSAILIIYGENVSDTAWPFGVFIVAIFVVAYMRRAFLLESISLVAANLGVGFLLPILWDRLRVYQQNRITNFLDPGADKLGVGWQVIQSKIAIGSGGMGGKGYLAGTQKALEFLPEKHTDFIFSVVGEELGFFGASGVLLLFGVLIFRAVAIGQKCKSEFASNVCVGIAAYLFFQVVINVAMTVGMAPVTGIPLPFISYGGSSLLVSSFLVGVLLNCRMRWYEY